MTNEKIFLVKAKAETKYGTKIEDALFELDAEGKWIELTKEEIPNKEEINHGLQVILASNQTWEERHPRCANLLKKLESLQ